MIDSAMIKRLAIQCNVVDGLDDIDSRLEEFAKACYQAGKESLNLRVARLFDALKDANDETKLYKEHEGFYAEILSAESDNQWLKEKQADMIDVAMNICYDYDCKSYSNVSLAEVVCVDIGDKLSSMAQELRKQKE